jgi:hypothetical protein
MFEKLEIGPKSQAFWRRQTRNIRKTGGGPDKGAQRRSRILHKLGHDQIRKDTRRLGILSWTRFDPNETFAAHNQTARIDVERSSGVNAAVGASHSDQTRLLTEGGFGADLAATIAAGGPLREGASDVGSKLEGLRHLAMLKRVL